MIELIDFSKCEFSSRNLEYGGRAGEKRGIIFNNDFYILKFPKSTEGMKKVEGISYVTSPLSEYIGCHIFNILGFDVQETILGVCYDGRRYKTVCACKDFIVDERNELLIPYTALRNDSNPILTERNESTSNTSLNIYEIIFQLQNNTILSRITEAEERFWDVAIIDMLINNNDRNEDNWGVIKYRNDSTYKLAPIFDCGNCFYGKTSDERLKTIYSNSQRLYDSALDGITAYENNDGKRIKNRELVLINNEKLRFSMIKIAKLVNEKTDEISAFINSIPSSFMGVPIMSDERKKYYLETFKIRFEKILLKAIDDLNI